MLEIIYHPKYGCHDHWGLIIEKNMNIFFGLLENIRLNLKIIFEQNWKMKINFLNN